MRQSVAALALIQRLGPAGVPEHLLHWSTGWEMFSLVGGHVEPDESFRQCCIREVAEELGLIPDVDFRVAREPLRSTQEYTAMSKPTNVETKYRVELFATELLTPSAIVKATASPVNRWVSELEVCLMSTADGKPVSAQVNTVLKLFGVIPCLECFEEKRTVPQTG